MDTQTQIDRLIELAIIQRSELKQLVEQLPQLREHLNAEVEKVFDETEPQLRAELEEWTTKQTADKTAALGVTLEAKIADLAKSLEVSTQARYNAIIAEREENARLAAQAEAKIAEHAASLPSAVKEIVSAELARFPRAGEIDQLRKEFAEPKSLNPRGKWQAGETYNKLDLVTINGDSYTSNTDGNRTRPSRSSADWTLVAARGTGGGGGPTSLSELTTVPSDGDVLIGSGTSWVTSNLTAGAGISITVGPGAITISATDGDITLDDGTAASPSLHFTNDADTGIYRPAANTLGISVSGTQVAYFDENGLTVPSAGVVAGGSIHAGNGNANNPSLSFDGDQDTGFFRHQPNEIGIALGGTQYATLTSTTFSITPVVTMASSLRVNGTTDSSNKDTGAIVTEGGLGVEKSATIGGNLTVSGTAPHTFNTTTSDAGISLLNGSVSNNVLVRVARDGGLDAGVIAICNGGSATTVIKGTGASTIGGTLTVSGITTLNSYLQAGAALAFPGALGATNYYLYASSTLGAVLYGYGSTYDVHIANRSGGRAISVDANTTNVGIGGNLTVSGTTGVTATDLTLGTSGPSVKSSLSARAPRQGLVFNGTAGATVTLPAFGTTDFTVAVWLRADVVAAKAVLDGNNGLLLDIGATGTFRFYSRAGSASLYTSSAGTIVAGKTNLLVYSRGSVYLNGVALQTGISDGANYTGSISHIGSSYVGGDPITGFVSALIYNRALSASEVVALYEAGAPAGADYNSASNTAINTSNFVNGGTAYGTFDGVSATGFHAIKTAGTQAFAGSRPVFSVATGRRFLATFTATLTSGVAPTVFLANSTSGASRSGASSVAAGSNSVVLTATSTDSSAALTFYNNPAEAAEFTISSVSLTPLGLLLAPDAAQAGGGLTWYDTSGNAANITLPASGVSWNVPSSRVLGGDWTNTGTLTVSGTGASSFAGRLSISSTTGVGLQTALAVSSSSGLGVFTDYTKTSGTSRTWSLGATGSSSSAGDNAFALYDGTAAAFRFLVTSNGNFLIGGTIDGGQKLQVSGTGYISGDLTVGAKTGAQSTPDKLQMSSGYPNTSTPTNQQLKISLGYVSATQNYGFTTDSIARIWYHAGDTVGPTGGHVFATGGIAALTLDSSQNATFAGNVTVNGTGTQSFKGTIALKAAAVGDGITLRESYAGNSLLFSVLQNSGDGTGATIAGADGAGNTTFSVNTQTGAATFSGAIAIGNTVNTVSPTSPNRTITMVIGGTTYYIHAKTTND